MPAIRTFGFLPVRVPRYRILKRLGYNSRTNDVPAGTMAEIDRVIESTADLIGLKAAVLRGDSAVAAGFGSSKLNGFLNGAEEILLMGITGGSAVTDEIERLKTSGSLTEAVIVDAAAGEIVDEGFNRLAEIYSRELLREGRSLSSRRFSAGYGDFDICFQRDIYSSLDLGSIGIKITETCLLLPEKSVTAIYGITGNDNE